MQTEDAPSREHCEGVQTPSGLALLIHILTRALREQPAYQLAEHTGQKSRAEMQTDNVPCNDTRGSDMCLYDL